jgi:hypothetical protein
VTATHDYEQMHQLVDRLTPDQLGEVRAHALRLVAGRSGVEDVHQHRELIQVRQDRGVPISVVRKPPYPSWTESGTAAPRGTHPVASDRPDRVSNLQQPHRHPDPPSPRPAIARLNYFRYSSLRGNADLPV